MGMKIDPLDSDASYHAWRVDVEALLVIKGCEEAIDHDDGNEMSTDGIKHAKTRKNIPCVLSLTEDEGALLTVTDNVHAKKVRRLPKVSGFERRHDLSFDSVDRCM